MKRFAITAALATVVIVGAIALGLGRQGNLSATTLDTGYLNPSTNAPDAGGAGDGFETHPEYAYTDGSGAAESMGAWGDTHHYGGYNVSVPAGATITGIEVRADWWLAEMGWEDELSVCLSWDGGTSTSCKMDMQMEVITERTVVLGSPTDTWGHTWTTDELSNDNLLVRVEIQSMDGWMFQLDWIPVRVYYEGAADTATPTPTDTSTSTPTDTPTSTP